jgi:hypothetical protein
MGRRLVATTPPDGVRPRLTAVERATTKAADAEVIMSQSRRLHENRSRDVPNDAALEVLRGE